MMKRILVAMAFAGTAFAFAPAQAAPIHSSAPAINAASQSDITDVRYGWHRGRGWHHRHNGWRHRGWRHRRWR